MERTAPQGLVRQFPEPPLHQVQPGRGRGCEMQVEPRMFLQPGPDVGMFMCRVIVEDKMHGQPVRDFLLECFQERHELLSLIHISEPTRRTPISYAVFCLKK